MSAPSSEPADRWIPERPTLRRLARAADDCRACPLYRGASQAVLGEGDSRARLMLVGEMPGDEEDREGRPFVGPAGRFLDKLLAGSWWSALSNERRGRGELIPRAR